MAEHTEKDDLEFTKTIGSLKKSEGEAKEIVNKANADSDVGARASRVKAENILEKAREEAVKAKDSILLESKRGVENDASGILKDAAKEAEALAKRKLSPAEARKLAMGLLE